MAWFIWSIFPVERYAKGAGERWIGEAGVRRAPIPSRNAAINRC